MLMPMGDIPEFHANRLGGERLAVLHGDDRLTWGELARRVTRRANALLARGVAKDDIVAISLPNCNALYELAFACWKVGATPSLLSHRLPPQEFSAILDIVRPKVVFASNPDILTVSSALPSSFGLSEGEDLPVEAVVGTYWKAMTSGGSTGRPKVIIDHQPGAVDPFAPLLNVPQDKSVLNPGPLYHNAPFRFTVGALHRGNCVVSMTKFDAEEALKLIDRHSIAWAMMVPTMMSRIWRLPDDVRARYDLSSLQAVWHSAAPMPAWLKDAWIEWIGAEKVWEIYGGTERQGNTILDGAEWQTHRGSVGRAFNCSIRILDDSGRELTTGEIGEVFMRPDAGAGQTYHYLGATPRIAADGYESIGDFGWLDEDGYLFLADRRTDLIISGGANIYPAEVESVLMEHPDVDTAVVIGIPHEDMGVVPHAIIKRTVCGAVLEEEALSRFVEQRLTRSKTPRSYEFTNDDLRDDAGKVRRAELRARALNRLAAS
ncbi:AMP-binding protein [Sphingosinicella xenopeptidilytica]|uniref:AMP-binding protein n=1 Tax=Sphingosinicella xenopeptidilytica TaxID=364098 RepID=A0ABW3C3Q6_SPHXN